MADLQIEEFTDEQRDDFAGYGAVITLEGLDDTPPEQHGPGHPQLGELRATAICGNDISSSCLYVSAICAIFAGPYAPLSLLIVAAILYLFRKIYGEVGTALPLNGGAYNVLLNTTSKAWASVAACLTILSYVATAVISAFEAMSYAGEMYHSLNVMMATIVLLAIFAFLNIIGITESAAVATAIFIFHISTLSLLVLACGYSVAQNPAILYENLAVIPPQGAGRAIFFGFAAALLGVSGFESSANFIEEQARGVFVKTLRNMWLAVAFFNPVISFLSLGLVRLADFEANKETLLTEMGRLSILPWLGHMVSIDAVLVLSGAVLTSFVGVSGLVRRMSLDRCLPQWLLLENKWRRTNHYILLLFFGLCTSILLVTQGEVKTLAGVYTISFLGVMALFALGNMMLKVKRSRLPRDVKASWPGVCTAFAAVVLGIFGNVVLNPQYVWFFFIYFVSTGVVVALMFLRIRILRGILFVSQSAAASVNEFNQNLLENVNNHIEQINSLTVIYFSKGDHLSNLNRAALYVLQNEQTRRLEVVHVYRDKEEIPPTLEEHVSIIDHEYPQLKVDLILVQGAFGPALIESLSQRMNVPKNYMFIGTPGDRFPHNIAELGGVRLIL
ncbi:MAG: APC family permease [Vulcanimicrobiota bacterium]